MDGRSLFTHEANHRPGAEAVDSLNHLALEGKPPHFAAMRPSPFRRQDEHESRATSLIEQQPGSEPIDIPETIPNPVVVPKHRVLEPKLVAFELRLRLDVSDYIHGTAFT